MSNDNNGELQKLDDAELGQVIGGKFLGNFQLDSRLNEEDADKNVPDANNTNTKLNRPQIIKA